MARCDAMALLCAIGNQRTHRPGTGLSIGEAVPIGRLRTPARPRTMHREAQMQDNGDRDLVVTIGKQKVVGIGSFHKSLPHNEYGEVVKADWEKLIAATASATGDEFEYVPPEVPKPKGPRPTAPLTNPTAGLVDDHLIGSSKQYTIPPAPTVKSDTTAAEMVELYWMALLRDLPFDAFATDPDVASAVADINDAFGKGCDKAGKDSLKLRPGIDVPGWPGSPADFTPANLFRLGLAGEDIGPMVSQFFIRPIAFGTQTIDTRQRPYKAGMDYLSDFDTWRKVQDSGRDAHGRDYSGANESDGAYFESGDRYISTMRDLARFVNKDALHQAYFNAALLLLSGGAGWTPGNPFADDNTRDSGFGVLGGPHILALVSEVATRALKAVWRQKWQVHLRLRPEAFGGLAHVQKVGVPNMGTRAYGLKEWLFDTDAAKRISRASETRHKTPGYLLPMAYTPGSPTHPAYGAGHATVAGACVTVLKAYFKTFDVEKDDTVTPLPFSTLTERSEPYGPKTAMKAYVTGLQNGEWKRIDLGPYAASHLTIEGELNKLAHNVAMGRSMGGVHWRTDNARSLILGEALAAKILYDIASNLPMKAKAQVKFTFRTFAREDGRPKLVEIDRDGIRVNKTVKQAPISEL
jgi:hypothetical protein